MQIGRGSNISCEISLDFGYTVLPVKFRCKEHIDLENDRGLADPVYSLAKKKEITQPRVCYFGIDCHTVSSLFLTLLLYSLFALFVNHALDNCSALSYSRLNE